jgi:hypothetical protein
LSAEPPLPSRQHARERGFQPRRLSADPW